MVHYARVLFLVLVSTAVLSACGQKKEEAGTQVAAKVDGEEISVHQINYAMSHMGNIPKGKEEEAGKQILKGLVDQQILVKKAVNDKLDRNPNVLQALEASRRQILAQATLEQMAQQLTKPTDAEIHDYYVKTPDLFSNRRIYKFAEISMAGSAQTEKVKQLLSGTRSLDEFAKKLNNENIAFKGASAVKAAEELPIVLLPKFARMAKGEVAIIPTGDNLSVLQLQDFKEQPLTEEQAKPVIAKFLFEQKRKTLVEAEMKKLRDAAKIEYRGAYADAGKAAQNAAATQAAPADAEPAKAGTANDNHVEKGLSGLK